jgi:hypothetical protein
MYSSLRVIYQVLSSAFKYCRQHFAPQHTQFKLFSQSERPSFASAQDNMQLFFFLVFFYIWVCRQGVGRRLNRTKHFSNPICSQFNLEYNFEFFTVVPKHVNFPYSKRIYFCSCTLFVLYYDDETWAYNSVFLRVYLHQNC